MTPKTKRIISIAVMGLPTLVLIMGGVMKLLNAEPEPVMKFLTQMGFSGCITVLGFTEILVAALLIYSKTSKLGFLLATGYFGGALSLEISGEQFPASIIFLMLLWIGMFLKEKEMFLGSDKAGR